MRERETLACEAFKKYLSGVIVSQVRSPGFYCQEKLDTTLFGEPINCVVCPQLPELEHVKVGEDTSVF